MRSRDVIALYDAIGTGAHVFIEDRPMADAAAPLLAPGASMLPAATLPTLRATR